jgi:arginine exporter protein ArgO
LLYTGTQQRDRDGDRREPRFRAALPHLLGVSFGFATMLIAGSAGVAALLLTYPYIAASIKWAGFAFLLFIAWQLARSHPHVTRVAGQLKCTTEGRNRGVQNTPLLGYIGTGDRVHPKRLQVEPGVSLVDPKTESTLMAAIKQLLRD